MKILTTIFTVALLLTTTGCRKDDRALQAISLATVAASTCQTEMKAAPDDATRANIAQTFLKDEVPLLQGVEDYMFGVTPAAAAPAPKQVARGHSW